ncbi:MFS transporter [Rhodococcus sp. Leaf278]|uniref:MFS transporter n=1 Tax=Rhodococcus sp. Leaf278 TaxID=1736319 RepID=UPI00070FFE39|nr:MFS transporter [Rhodococcus sp. Leaf278]KQU56729.1 MFS transporter [Rhodococcus sp. Leaf278]
MNTDKSEPPLSTAPAEATTAPINHRRQLFGGILGHGIEFFDFLAYAYLAVYFSTSFFPESDSRLLPLLQTFGVFAIGFLARPVAGLVIGLFADRFGRRRAMTLTISMMAGGSVMIALSPTYEQVGILAPVILVTARLLQGLSAGGEYTSASAFIVESAPKNRRGFYSSFMFVASTSGKLFALGFITLLVTVLGTETMTEWGWRIPFAVGGLGAVVAWWIRRTTVETLDVSSEKQKSSRPRPFDAIRAYPKQTLQIFFLTTGLAVGQYFWATYLTAYFEIKNGAASSTALVAGMISLVFYLAIQPLAGLLSDRIGRKPSLYIYGISSIVLTIPLLSIEGTSLAVLILVQATGMLMLSFATSIGSAVMVEMFPARVRVTGLGFPYSLSIALFGGTVPLIATALEDAGHSNYFAWYVVATAAVSLVAAFTLRESRDVDIESDDLRDTRAVNVDQ